ncbi:acylneuraminate cytidylyltransferase family protein (plasmid) [Sulfitobacter faviae]|uniref:Acylneuraminate cytidylyltransferase family protein n=1 Tax=Sulfitobacter faviae TaxID=1775881 RepID=A0ABZ0V3Y6_9RHOB|nr:acylneuraminate cytidylyltransferase family protein [Sulfitobacter faviae]WPZ23585.1 acylneuraminate cytidylyltransferase family protein [Sulfitobacter faviae]
MSGSLTAFIFARGGSKGLPGKNIRPFAGKPLIGWAVEQALAVERIGRVIVSTDSAEIADVARHHGAEVPFMRPVELANDRAPEMLAWRHALEFLRETEGVMPDPFISVPATSPLRFPEDIDACIKEYDRSGADVVLSVTPAHRSPWFNMVARSANGGFSLVNDDGKRGRIARRQDAPQVFDITTVTYVARPDYVLSHLDLFSGRVTASVVPVERSADIDTLFDFDIAEFLMKQRMNNQ